MAEPPVLRRATPDDLDAIMLLETSTFEADAWSRRTMQNELAAPHAYYLVVDGDDPGTVAAYAGLLAPIGTGQGDIQTIAVAPDQRRRGLGRTLMEALLEEARRREVREMFLEVRADNPNAQTLYDSLGFVQIGVRPNYYPSGVAAHTMRLEL